jgi:Domain of unknown function (DUF6438)
MFGTGRSRIALATVVFLGAFSYCERESLAPLACVGDRACAAARAKALGDAKMPERSSGLADKAYDLAEALERDECEDAAGPAGSIRSIEKQVRDPHVASLVSRALLAYQAYCFVPFPETRTSCAGSLACALDRTDVLVARVEASRGDRNLSRLVRALRASLKDNDCPAVADVARALRRRSLATIVPPKIAQALERSLEATAGYCGDRPDPAVPAPPRGATISLERTACSGSCPHYRVTVGADGRVTRAGDLGDNEHTIPEERARVLFDSFARLHFADRKPSYPRLDGDEGPGYALTLDRDAVAFTATAESACRLDDPAVCYLGLEVDEVAETPGR